MRKWALDPVVVVECALFDRHAHPPLACSGSFPVGKWALDFGVGSGASEGGEQLGAAALEDASTDCGCRRGRPPRPSTTPSTAVAQTAHTCPCHPSQASTRTGAAMTAVPMLATVCESRVTPAAPGRRGKGALTRLGHRVGQHDAHHAREPVARAEQRHREPQQATEQVEPLPDPGADDHVGRQRARRRAAAEATRRPRRSATPGVAVTRCSQMASES